MSLKKYLLASGLSTVLLLGACGGVDTSTEEEPVEEETSEEASEDTENAESEEETTDESSEDLQALEDENEELKAQNQEQQDQIATLEEELAEANESTEEIDTEESEDASNEIEPEDESESMEGVETVKEVEINDTVQIENVNMTVNMAQINRVEVNEDLAIFLDGYEVGDKIDNLVIEYTIENTTEAARDFFIDQSVVVTSTGQQLDPDMFLSENITASMLGAVEFTGSVPYIMDEGSGDDIEWIDINIPAMLDGESYDRVSEEQQYRIEF